MQVITYIKPVNNNTDHTQKISLRNGGLLIGVNRYAEVTSEELAQIKRSGLYEIVEEIAPGSFPAEGGTGPEGENPPSFIPYGQRGKPSGVATLDAEGHVPSEQMTGGAVTDTDPAAALGALLQGDGTHWTATPPGTVGQQTVVRADGTIGYATTRYSLKSWGAAIDGVTDDGAKLNEAIEAVSAKGGGVIYWLGDCLTARKIVGKPGVQLAGEHHPSWYEASTAVSRLLLKATGFSGSCGYEIGPTVTGSGAVNMMVNGQGSGEAVDGIVCYGKDNAFSDVTVRGCGGYGVRLEGSAEATCQENKLQRAWAIKNSKSGFLFKTKSYDHQLHGCLAHDNGEQGFEYGADCNNIESVAPKAEWNRKAGFLFSPLSGSGNRTVEAFTQGNYENGFVFQKTDGNVMQHTGPRAEGDGWATGVGAGYLIEGESAGKQCGPILLTGATSVISPEGGNIYAPAYGVRVKNAYQVDIAGEFKGVLASVKEEAEANVSLSGQTVLSIPMQSTLIVELKLGDTEATLASVTGFSATGIVQVGIERIEYTGKNEGTKKLTGLTRKALGTIEAAHIVGTVVAIPSAGETRSRVMTTTVAGGITFPGSVSAPEPLVAGNVATKGYTDALFNARQSKAAVQWATVGPLPEWTRTPNTFTGVANGALSVDGPGTVSVGERVLVKNEPTAAYNGIYSVTKVGGAAEKYQLVRVTDMNEAAQFPGAFVLVEKGTVNEATGWFLALKGPVELGTTAINFTRTMTAGAGISITKNQISAAPEQMRAESAEMEKLARAANLADLTSASTARASLGLSAAATATIGFASGNVMPGNATLDQIAAPAAGISFGAHLFSFGTGDLLGARVSAPPAAHVLDIRDGTAASPALIGVSASYSRFDATTRAEVNTMGPEGTDGPDGATVARFAIKGLPASQVQISAIVASSWQTGEYASPGADATPVIGLARTSGSATGRAIGAYFESTRETSTSGGQQGTEIRVKNLSGVSDAYVKNGPSKSMGSWVNAGGTSTSAAAFQIGHGFGQTFEVGYAANEGSITGAFLRDDSGAAISYDIHGEHSEATIMIREKAGPITFNTAAGNFKIQQASVENAFMTGTKAGDGVILTGAKVIHIGAGSGRAQLRVGENFAIGSNAADSFGGGKGVTFMANAVTNPTTNPTGGGILYVTSSSLTWRGAAGNVVTIASNEPLKIGAVSGGLLGEDTTLVNKIREQLIALGIFKE